jgi:tetratricopeptide (TPR) repeat protein
MFRAILFSTLMLARTAQPDTCPDGATLEKAQRRAQAERWFTRGEEAVKEDRVLEAQRAFQCSLSLVPHGFTAYNLGQLAERVGDLDLAISAYDQYLLLTPGATDAKVIEEKLAQLRERMAKAQSAPSAPPAAPVETVAAPLAQPPVGPAPVVNRRVFPRWVRTAGYVSLAAGGALTLTGVVFNLGARAAMDTCRSRYSANDVSGAHASCSSARQQAYTSYALFGIGATAAASAAVLLLLPTSRATVTATSDSLSMLWYGRF